MNITAIAFDLDDTLLDTSRILIPVFGSPEFEHRIARPLPLMPGALENLRILKKSYKLFLVTQGDRRIQQQKISSLNVAEHFDEIFYAENQLQQTKRTCFQNLLQQHSLKPSELLSVGNRRSAEIREAKKLGCWTCLFLHGEHLNEPAEVPEDHPDFEISHHYEMIKVCKL